MTIDAKCVTVDRSTRVKVEERGKKAVIYNKLSEKIYIIKVDGCVCQNETAADFVISKHGVGDVIVELKGKDVEQVRKDIKENLKQKRDKRKAS